MKTIQWDRYSLQADEFRPQILPEGLKQESLFQGLVFLQIEKEGFDKYSIQKPGLPRKMKGLPRGTKGLPCNLLSRYSTIVENRHDRR